MSVADDRYNHSGKGRARNVRYDGSDKGRARHVRYQSTLKYVQGYDRRNRQRGIANGAAQLTDRGLA